MKWLLAIICVVLAVMRFTLTLPPPRLMDSYKDAAHLFVGGLFGAAIASSVKGSPSKWLWTMAVALTVIEVVAALLKVF